MTNSPELPLPANETSKKKDQSIQMLQITEGEIFNPLQDPNITFPARLDLPEVLRKAQTYPRIYSVPIMEIPIQFQNLLGSIKFVAYPAYATGELYLEEALVLLGPVSYFAFVENGNLFVPHAPLKISIIFQVPLDNDVNLLNNYQLIGHINNDNYFVETWNDRLIMFNEKVDIHNERDKILQNSPNFYDQHHIDIKTAKNDGEITFDNWRKPGDTQQNQAAFPYDIKKLRDNLRFQFVKK